MGVTRLQRRRGVAAASLAAGAVLALWATPVGHLSSLPFAPSAGCLWGCPTVALELFADRTATTAADAAPPCTPKRGFAENHTVVFYDSDEKPLRIEADTSGDGEVDRWEYFSTAGGDAPVRVERDCNGDRRVDRWEFRDSSGAPVRVELDEDFDGIVDRTLTSTPAPRG